MLRVSDTTNSVTSRIDNVAYAVQVDVGIYKIVCGKLAKVNTVEDIKSKLDAVNSDLNIFQSVTKSSANRLLVKFRPNSVKLDRDIAEQLVIDSSLCDNILKELGYLTMSSQQQYKLDTATLEGHITELGSGKPSMESDLSFGILYDKYANGKFDRQPVASKFADVKSIKVKPEVDNDALDKLQPWPANVKTVSKLSSFIDNDLPVEVWQALVSNKADAINVKLTGQKPYVKAIRAILDTVDISPDTPEYLQYRKCQDAVLVARRELDKVNRKVRQVNSYTHLPVRIDLDTKGGVISDVVVRDNVIAGMRSHKTWTPTKLVGITSTLKTCQYQGVKSDNDLTALDRKKIDKAQVKLDKAMTALDKAKSILIDMSKSSIADKLYQFNLTISELSSKRAELAILQKNLTMSDPYVKSNVVDRDTGKMIRNVSNGIDYDKRWLNIAYKRDIVKLQQEIAELHLTQSRLRANLKSIGRDKLVEVDSAMSQVVKAELAEQCDRVKQSQAKCPNYTKLAKNLTMMIQRANDDSIKLQLSSLKDKLATVKVKGQDVPIDADSVKTDGKLDIVKLDSEVDALVKEGFSSPIE
jgi:hypothetical protein